MIMTEIDYPRISQRLMAALRMESEPVTVCFSLREPEGVQKLEIQSMACTMLDLARHEGRIF
jgi:uncharacterized protein (DUF169 family)